MDMIDSPDIIQDNETLTFTVDPEHAGIRLITIVLFLGGLVFWYLVVSLLLGGGFNLIAVIAAFVLTYGTTTVVEKQLKEKWPSGREITVSEEAVQILKKDKVQRSVDPQQQVNVLLWRFPVKRRTKVPKGWYVVSIALEQEGEYIPSYTFMSSEDFRQIEYSEQYVELVSKKELEKSKNRDMRLAGQQRRLHIAENERWIDGTEMTPEQYSQYIDYLKSHFPKWMPD